MDEINRQLPVADLQNNNPATIVYILLRVRDVVESSHFSDIINLHEIGFGYLSQDLLNRLLLQAAGPDSLEYEEVSGTETNLAVLDVLLAHNADINCRDTEGNSPLYRAVLHEQEREAEFLLERGAQVDDVYRNANDQQGETCLTTALQLGSYEMAKLLLQYGARIDVLDALGLLRFTAIHRDLQLLSLLVDAGADIFQKDFDGSTLADAVFRSAALDERALMSYVSDHYLADLDPSQIVFEARMMLNAAKELEDRICNLKFILDRGCFPPVPRQLDHAISAQAYHALGQLVSICSSKSISLEFPKDHDSAFLEIFPRFSDRDKTLKEGAKSCMEIIRRTCGSSSTTKHVLCRLNEEYELSENISVDPLSDLCILSIRKSLVKNNAGKIEEASQVLPLPKSLKEKICLKDLLEWFTIFKEHIKTYIETYQL